MTNPKPDGGARSIVKSFYRAFKSLGTTLPTLLGVVLLLGLFLTLVSKQFIASVFISYTQKRWRSTGEKGRE